MGDGGKCELHFESLETELQETVLIFITTTVLWENFKLFFILIDFLSTASV